MRQLFFNSLVPSPVCCRTSLEPVLLQDPVSKMKTITTRFSLVIVLFRVTCEYCDVGELVSTTFRVALGAAADKAINVQFFALGCQIVHHQSEEFSRLRNSTGPVSIGISKRRLQLRFVFDALRLVARVVCVPTPLPTTTTHFVY